MKVAGRRPVSLALGVKTSNEVYLMRLTVETEQEEDGRWVAEVSELAGVMKYGQSRGEAIAQAEELALRVIADRIEHGEHPVEPIQITFAAA
jgi:predicted RNase H-like HicB family nuclease